MEIEKNTREHQKIITNKKLPVMMAERFLKLSTLSKATGISRTTLTKIYYGKNKAISFDVLAKLCDFFNCDIAHILQYEKEQQRG